MGGRTVFGVGGVGPEAGHGGFGGWWGWVREGGRSGFCKGGDVQG